MEWHADTTGRLDRMQCGEGVPQRVKVSRGGSHSRQLQGAGLRRRTRDEGKAVTEGPNRANEWRGVPDVGAIGRGRG